MSSPPEPRTFEGWIAEDWPGATRRPDVMAVLEPYREAVQYALDDFDDETQSWRDQCGRIYGWGTGPHDEGAVPYAIQEKVSEMMSREPVTTGASAGAPDLDAWKAEAGEALAICAAPRRSNVGNVSSFADAARAGWPRDASRVAVLCERVAALEAALGEALDGWEGAVSDVGFNGYHTIARLRALLAAHAPAPKEPTR